MVVIKHYNNERWMRSRYLVQKKTPEQIAAEAGCSVSTIYSKLKEFGLIK